MKSYFEATLAVIGLTTFLWLSLPPFTTDNGQPLRVAMLTHSAGTDRQTVFLQWKSPRLKSSDVDPTSFPLNEYAGFGFSHAMLKFDHQLPLLPDYLLITMPRWFLLCLTMLAPLAWLFDRLARILAIQLTPPKRECDHCGYAFHSHKQSCPTCHTATALCQPA